MAFIDNTTWVGSDSEGFYSAALLTGDTKTMVQQYINIKSKEKISRLELGASMLQVGGDCAFTASGTETLSQQTIEVCPLKVNFELCKSTFENNYLSLKIKAGSNDENLPANLTAYLIKLLSDKISAETESLFWNGDTSASPAGVCNGIFKTATLAPNVGNVLTVTATTLTASNIFAEINKVYEKIPFTIRNRGKVVIFVSNAAASFYKEAIAAINPLGGTYNAGDYTLNYLGIKLVIAPGMTANQMFACEPLNIGFGTDLIGDYNEVKLLDLEATTGEPKVRVIMQMKFGTVILVPEECVTYHA